MTEHTHSDPSPFHASRRTFLTAAAGVSAAMAGISGVSMGNLIHFAPDAAPAGKAKPRAALKDGDPIKIGVIGMGGPGQGSMGLNHIRTIAGMNREGKEKVIIAAICDVNQFNMDYVTRHLAEWG